MEKEINKQDLLTIKQFAQVCRTTPRTIRFYEQKGLISPTFVDPWTKYRYYDKELAREFLKIKLIQNFSVPLSKITDSKTNEALLFSLERQLQTVKEEIREKEKQLAFLKDMKRFMFDEPNMNRLLKRETIGPFILLSMHVSHADYDKGNMYMETVYKEAQKLGLPIAGQTMQIYYQHEYKPRNASVDAAVVIKGTRIPKTELSKGFSYVLFPKIKVLSYTYRGPLTYFILVYQKLYRYFEPWEVTLKGRVFDIYYKGPHNTKSVYDYMAKLCFPVD